MARRERELARVEQLLRSHGPAPLSTGFKQNVLRQIAQLPDPELLAPLAGLSLWQRMRRLLGPGELAAICLLLLGCALCFIPAVTTVISAWQWELASLNFSLDIGGQVFTGSLLSVLALAAGGVFLAGAGVYATRHNLVSA